MHKYVTFIAAILFSAPLLAGAQATATDPGPLPQTFMLPLGTSTEPVKHGEVTVDIGIERRFSESPKTLADVDLPASRVINTRRLQVFTRHIALTEPIKMMNVGDDKVRVRLTGPGKLIGLIPVDLTYEVTAMVSDEGLTSVKTKRLSDGWWSWLATKPNPKTISQKVRSTVKSQNYLSITQLRAVVVEAIVNAV